MRTQSFGHVQTLMQAIEALHRCATEEDFTALAQRIDEGTKPAEFNFHADVVMLTDSLLYQLQSEGKVPDLAKALADLRVIGEEGMLQLAFFNLGIQVPSPFIIKAHEAGWRYTSAFHQVKSSPPFELSAPLL